VPTVSKLRLCLFSAPPACPLTLLCRAFCAVGRNCSFQNLASSVKVLVVKGPNFDVPDTGFAQADNVFVSQDALDTLGGENISEVVGMKDSSDAGQVFHSCTRKLRISED
jgi:hypothetical protein